MSPFLPDRYLPFTMESPMPSKSRRRPKPTVDSSIIYRLETSPDPSREEPKSKCSWPDFLLYTLGFFFFGLLTCTSVCLFNALPAASGETLAIYFGAMLIFGLIGMLFMAGAEGELR